jgi:hypothetical protein
MKYHLALLALLFWAVTENSSAQKKSTIISFYAVADSVASYPDIQQKMLVRASKRVQIDVNKFKYVTFVGFEKSTKVSIIAITDDAIIDPNGDISRTVEFREIKPSFGKVSTWGYVFDRNNDGEIDYLELVEGATAVEPANFPKNFPERKKRMNAQQEEYFINHCTLVFTHWADDNYDGRLDAAVVPDLDPVRDWVMRRVCVRSSAFNGALDDVWTFRSSITGKHEKLKAGPRGVSYLSMVNTTETITERTFNAKSNVLQLINEVAKSVGLTAGSFPSR